MNVLVTGCNGFIGRYICSAFVENNHTVIGLDKGLESKVKLNKYISSDIKSENFAENISNQLPSVECIIHTAALIDKNDLNPELINVNIIGTLNILKAAIKLDAHKIISISSAPIIGSPLYHPIDEKHPIKPRSLYHATKAMQEYILDLSPKYGIKSVDLRIPSPIGVGMNPNTILPVFIDKCLKNDNLTILGKGTRKQNYIDVRDIADFAVKSAENDTIDGTYNVASPTTISNFKLAEKCVKLTNSLSKIIMSNTADSEDDIIWDYSINRAQKVGFTTKYSIDETINDIIGEMRKEI